MKEKQNMKRDIILLIVVVVLLPSIVFGREWHVDASAAANGADGSAEKPYATIQAGVNAAKPGDTVLVAPGDYASGSVDLRGDGSQSRVAFDGKTNITVRSTCGKALTHIVGAAGAGEESCGAGAVRCIIARASTNVVVSGFTLRDGHTQLPGGDFYAGRAGAVLVAESNYEKGNAGLWLVDCVVSNCSAQYYGAISGGGAVRCLFSENTSSKSSSVALRSIMAHCVISGNVATNSDSYQMIRCDLINCTITGNHGIWSVFGNSLFRNSITELSGINRECNTDTTTLECSVNGTEQGAHQLVAPALGDFRLNERSAAIGIGNPAYLAAVPVPDGVEIWMDYYGRVIDRDATSINAGAAQEVVAVAGGTLRFDSVYHYPVVINGIRCPARTYIHPLAYPVQYRVTPTTVDGVEFFGYIRNDLNAFADRDGGFWMMPPPGRMAVITNTFAKAQDVLWVDERYGSDDNAGTEAAPFATLQKASDRCSRNRTVVYVKPGVYTNGCNIDSYYGNSRLASNASYEMLFRSTDGPDLTHIVGAASEEPTNEDVYPGCGPGAIRCVRLRGGSGLSGFTLRDGYVSSSSGNNIYVSGGGVVGFQAAYYPYAMVLDCVISNTVSQFGSQSIFSQRTRWFGNRSYRSLLPESCLSAFSYFCNTHVNGSDGSVDGVIYGTNYNCTVYGVAGERVSAGYSMNVNTVIHGGVAMYSSQRMVGSLAWQYGGNWCKDPFVEADPLFVEPGSPVNGAVSDVSPARFAGVAPAADNYGANYAMVAMGDINGDAISFSDSGAPAAGAFQSFAPALVVSAPLGGLSVSGAAIGTNALTLASTVTIAPGVGSRPCVGFVFGGVTNLFADAPHFTVTGEQIGANGLAELRAVYSTHWYVDPSPERGDDVNNTGFLPSSPKQTFAGVMAAGVVGGDTVHAAAGTYDAGVMYPASSHTVGTRVVVPSGVTVVADEGPEVTVIAGSDAETSPDEDGCGRDATRCAYLRLNACLKGFTLTGGRSNRGTSTDDMNFLGAAVMGDDIQGRDRSKGIIVEHCIISNNIASFGVVCRVQLVNSCVLDNVSDNDILRQASVYGSYVDRNTGTTLFNYGQSVKNCTFGPDNIKLDGTKMKGIAALGISPADRARIYNSLICLPISPDNVRLELFNTIYQASGSSLIASSTSNECSVATNESALVLSETGRPIIGTTAGVDAGDETLLDEDFGDHENDLGGFQRVMNGAIDIGCYEADWRGLYAETLLSRLYLTVNSASSGVRKIGDIVAISSGMLDVSLTNKAERSVAYGIPVCVTGSGTLSVMSGDALLRTVRAADGDVVLALDSKEAFIPLSFIYVRGEDDAGYAAIGKFSRTVGGLFFVVR